MKVSTKKALTISSSCCLIWTFISIALAVAFGLTYSLRPEHPCNNNHIVITKNATGNECLLLDEDLKVSANMNADLSTCSPCDKHFYNALKQVTGRRRLQSSSGAFISYYTLVDSITDCSSISAIYSHQLIAFDGIPIESCSEAYKSNNDYEK
jgi:hypothetical protein